MLNIELCFIEGIRSEIASCVVKKLAELNDSLVEVNGVELLELFWYVGKIISVPAGWRKIYDTGVIGSAWGWDPIRMHLEGYLYL